MCGIYGFKVRTGEELTQFESTALTTHLARRMESRGRDSWGGVILPDPNSDSIEARIFKNVGKVTETGSNMFRAASTAQAFLGHTRAATVGKISVENSHPFLVGEVLGVHNGSIYNYDELNTKYNRTFEVDSTQIFAHINDSLDLAEIEGAGTFFYTKRDEEWKHIYLAKTSNGSLYVARFFRDSSKKQGTHFAIVWASERSAVEEAAALIGATQQEIGISSGQVYAIHEDGDLYDIKQDFPIKSWAKYTDNWNVRPAIGSPFYLEFTAEPFINNIKDGNATNCSECQCFLTIHTWGECARSSLSVCKAKKAKERCSNKDVKVCRSCGCYLIEPIHEILGVNTVWCSGCKKTCVSSTYGRYRGGTQFIMCGNGCMSEDSDSDFDTLADLTLRLAQASGAPGLGKRARKKLIEKAARKAKKAWADQTAEPHMNSLRPLDSLSKAFIPSKSGNGEVVATPICSHCLDNLDTHVWGWCTRNGEGSCKAVKGKSCDIKIPLCRKCGCFLAEGVHTQTDLGDEILHCITCDEYCISEESVQEADVINDVPVDLGPPDIVIDGTQSLNDGEAANLSIITTFFPENAVNEL